MSEAPLPEPEFSRPIDVRAITEPVLALEATPEECAALAVRFDLVRIDWLLASIDLVRNGNEVAARGRLRAAIVQSCAVSGEDLPVAIDEALDMRFVPAITAVRPEAEIEIGAEDCDEIPYDGTRFDLGEAVAQSLALAIDPFAEGPGAKKIRAAGLLGDAAPGPFAGLAALKGRLEN